MYYAPQVTHSALKLKHKLKYKSHYNIMYDYVSPEKLMNALKVDIPLYSDVNVNGHWVEESQKNDNDLV